jgi:hypothetical protein
MRKFFLVVGFVFVSGLSLCFRYINTKTAAVELIPREMLFNPPQKSMMAISPNGEYISFCNPFDGVQNVYIARAESPSQGGVSMGCNTYY